MAKIEIWDSKTPFLLADGKERTMDEVAEHFPFIKTDTVVLEFAPRSNRVEAINAIGTIIEVCKIEDKADDMTDEEIVETYKEWLKKKKEGEKTNEEMTEALKILGVEV